MRRKERHIVNGALIGASVTALADIFIQWMDHMDRGEKFTWEKYNGVQTLKNSLKGGLLGAGAGYLLYEYKISEESKLPFNSDEYLKNVLFESHLNKNPGLLESVQLFRGKVKQWLSEQFGDSLVCFPEDTGSFIKRTAIHSKYDLDIVLPFKYDSYGTLEEMYNHTHDVIYKKFGDAAMVSKQTRAIGLTFEKDEQIIHFDIVPGREINDYNRDKDLNLYVRPDWAWQRGSSFKTNIHTQRQMTTNKPEERRAIKLLKLYRQRNGLSLPKIIIEQGVVEALSNNNYGSYSSDTENLLNSMCFIAKKLGQKTFFDHANTNNNLNDKMSDSDRSYFSNQLLNDVEKIEKNTRYIKEIFEC